MINTVKELKNKIEELSSRNEIVFITPHVNTDCDAIASSVAIDTILKKIGKKSYIVVDDPKTKMEVAVKTIINDLPDNVCVINTSNALDILKHNDVLLIVTDTNKQELIPFKDLQLFDDILVIDHHQVGNTTIKTDNLFIGQNISSASEISYQLLNFFNIRYENKDELIPNNLANYLLSGINLDTTKFTKNMGSNTMRVVSNLMNRGASMNYVNDLFLDSFENDMKIMNLVSKTAWNIYMIGIALDEEEIDKLYTKEDLAKAADFLLKYKDVSLAFAMGYIKEDTAYISGRSKGDINVGKIMDQFGGGGNEFSGAAQVKCDDIKQLKKSLIDHVKPGYYLK